MSAKHNHPILGMYVPTVLKTINFKTVILTILIFFVGATLFAQRIVFSGQDLLAPHLNDPSSIGLDNRFNVTGQLQVSNYDRRQHSQYIFAQIPFSNKISFGVDYFKDALDFYSYSTAMVSTAMRFDLGEDHSHLRLGVSGGIDSRRQTRFPAENIPNMATFVPKLNEGDTGFTYRLGTYYTYNALSIGATYNKLPIQSTLARADQEDLIGYWIKDGFTAHVRYSFYMSENLRLTPLFRYLSYANDPIYEGAVLVDVGNRLSASISYKNSYSINPAVRYEFLDVLEVGYSYEKSIGDVNFESLHSLSIAYKFKSEGEGESDWQQNARANNRKIAAIKQKKPKKEKVDELESEIEKKEEEQKEAAQKEAAEKEAAQKEIAEKEAAQKEAEAKEAAQQEDAQKEAAEKEAAQKEAAEKEAAQKEIAEKEAAQKEAEAREAAQQEAAQREATQKEAAEKEAAQKEAETKEAAQREAAEKEAAQKEAAEREAEQKVDQKEGMPVKENPTDELEPVELDPIQPRFAKDGSLMKKGYYVIVGTYNTMAQAEAEKERLATLEYYTAIGLKKGDDTLYLYVDYDDLNDDAKKRLRAHNLDPNFRKAYLLEVD